MGVMASIRRHRGMDIVFLVASAIRRGVSVWVAARRSRRNGSGRIVRYDVVLVEIIPTPPRLMKRIALELRLKVDMVLVRPEICVISIVVVEGYVIMRAERVVVLTIFMARLANTDGYVRKRR